MVDTELVAKEVVFQSRCVPKTYLKVYEYFTFADENGPGARLNEDHGAGSGRVLDHGLSPGAQILIFNSATGRIFCKDEKLSGQVEA